MLTRKLTSLAAASLMVANCASTPGEESNTESSGLGVGIAVFAVSFAIGYFLSDERLKQDVRHVGTLPNGLRLYSFRYWNNDRTFVSVMAQDLLEDERFRHAVFENESGYYMVDLGALGLDITGSRKQFFEAGQHALDGAEPVTN